MKLKYFKSPFTIILLGVAVSFFSEVSAETHVMQPSEKQSLVPLSEILTRSLNRVSTDTEIAKYQSSTWLATSPTVGFSYLSSQEDFGSDETEISINLAIKSGLQRDIDRRLTKLNKQIQSQQSELGKLYFSGLIRESLWSYKIAKANQTYIQKKLSVLQQLQNNSELLVVAGETSDYGLLLVKKEIINTQLKALENRQELQKWEDQYQAVTGQLINSGNHMPDIIEEKLLSSQVNPSNHPKMLMLSSQWQQQKLMIKENSSSADPWTLSALAKTIETQGIQDKQVGVSFEMPISLVEANSQSIQNQSSQSKAKFELEYQQNLLALNQQINKNMSERRFLLEKQSLLESSLELSKKIMRQIEHLKAQNEMGQELVLRRVIDAIEIQNENAMIKILIHQNNSLLRQAAGLSL